MKRKVYEKLLEWKRSDRLSPIYYYSSDDSRMEIDFLFYHSGSVWPIEVKAGGNVHGRSIKLFREKYDLPVAVRLALLPFIRQEHLVNIPLYAAFAVTKWMTKNCYHDILQL